MRCVDGAYVVERLLGTDLLFSCALITEGLFSKSQKEIFPSPPQSPSLPTADNYEVFVYPEKHDAENAILARAIMLQMEINLAASSPYDVTYMDGSLTTALIHMYKAVNLIKGENAEAVVDDNYDSSFVSKKIKSEFEGFLASYKKILLGDGACCNKFWVGVPKYTSRNDIGKDHNWPAVYDDRAILTIVLEPGEYTTPILFTDDEAWHSNLPYQSDAMKELMVDCQHSVVDHQLNLLAMMVNHMVNFFAIFNPKLCVLMVNHFIKMSMKTHGHFYRKVFDGLSGI